MHFFLFITLKQDLLVTNAGMFKIITTVTNYVDCLCLENILMNC